MRGSWLFIRKHWRNTVYSNVWIALGAAAVTWQTTALLEAPSFYLAAFTGAATLFTYNFQRLVKLNDRPEYIEAGRNNWLFRNRRTLGWITVFAALASVLLFLQLSEQSWVLLAVGAALSLFYVIRFFPIAGRLRALRDIPYLKLYVIGLVWTLATVALPAIELQAELTTNEWTALLLERFSFVLAITIPFDIRDMRLDHPEQRTVAQLFGVKGARVFAFVWLLASFGNSLWLYAQGLYSLAVLIALAATAAFTAVLIYKVLPEKDEMYFTGWVDGTLVIQTLLVQVALIF